MFIANKWGFFLQIDEDEFEKWAYQFRAASVALDDREEKLAEATDSIERDMVGIWKIFNHKNAHRQ